jgi:hypothetical protein
MAYATASEHGVSLQLSVVSGFSRTVVAADLQVRRHAYCGQVYDMRHDLEPKCGHL